MNQVLHKIVANKELHAKWLNTLSFMENAGARKISACENPLTVDIIQLKHAAEEHRHAYYLKKQILKLGVDICENYKSSHLLAPVYTFQYLQRLDVMCSRYLQQHFNLSGSKLKFASYLFVTYAIEVRADELYPVYQQVLEEQNSKIMVKSIIIEEEGHLEEMIGMLQKFDEKWEKYANEIELMEKQLFNDWFSAISKEVLQYEQIGNALV